MRVFELYKRPVLVTRDSAHIIGDILGTEYLDNNGELYLDFQGIEAVTPSFIDELIGILESKVANNQEFKVILVNFPTRLTSKYSAIGRGRHIKIDEIQPGQWELSRE